MLYESEGYPYRWRSCEVSVRAGRKSGMLDFHQHVYYEVSLILSGNVKTLLRDRAEEGTHSRLVLTGPGMPHWMLVEDPTVYRRINLCFSEEFVEGYFPEWRVLAAVFGESGRILSLTDEMCEEYQNQLLRIREEKDPFRQRLLIYLFLSYVRDSDKSAMVPKTSQPPAFVVDALSYISTHYDRPIVAAALAWELGVGRTTLMTAFKRYTGLTLTEYTTRTRVRRAILLLQQGQSQEAVAVQVGFCNGSSMIRAFRHCYGMTPKQYMKQRER